jgi:hypothetical protein
VERLVGLLRRFPLPLSSPKAWQLDLLAAALAVRRLAPHVGAAGAGRRAALADIHAELRAAKAYGGMRSLCSCLR